MTDSLFSGAGLGDVAGVFGDLTAGIFGFEGSQDEANGYTQAAALASKNASIAAQSTALQETQLNQKIFKTLGAARADIGASGLAQSGTALQVMQASASQGALSKALVQTQGNINVNQYESEAQSDQAKAAAASNQGSGGLFGDILKGVGTAAALL